MRRSPARAVTAAPRLPLALVEHEVAPLNPARPARRVLGTGEPQGLTTRPHEHNGGVRVAGLWSPSTLAAIGSFLSRSEETVRVLFCSRDRGGTA
jgi:hypothetical protein